MTLSYQNTFRDKVAFSAYHLPRSPLILLIAAGFFLLATFGSVVPAVRQFPEDTPKAGLVVGFILCELLLAGFIFSIFAVITLLSMISRRNKPWFCEKKITLGEDSFLGESPYGKSETRWTMVQKLARTRRHIFVYLGQEMAVVIPRRAFESSTQWDTFYDICRQRTNHAG